MRLLQQRVVLAVVVVDLALHADDLALEQADLFLEVAALSVDDHLSDAVRVRAWVSRSYFP